MHKIIYDDIYVLFLIKCDRYSEASVLKNMYLWATQTVQSLKALTPYLYGDLSLILRTNTAEKEVYPPIVVF